MTLKIIGAGMGRTGTASLKVALEALGLGPCYHMTEVLKHPEFTQHWIAAAEGRPDWDRTFEGYAATVDNPGCNFWRELAAHYPAARVILTVRDPGQWFESTNETIHSADFAGFMKHSPFGDMIQKTMWDRMGNHMQDRAHMTAFFERHSADVVAALPPERLLVYRVSEGWEPLCAFLGVPVPDQPFPRINSREETRALLEGLMAASGKGGLSEEAMARAGRELHGDGQA